MRAEKHKDKDKDSKHADKMKEKDDDKHAEKTKDKDKDKTATTGTATGGKPATEPRPKSAPPRAGGSRRHVRSYCRQYDSSHSVAGRGAGPGNGIIRVSDGKGNSIIIPDHGSGVTVTPAGPGHVTISNGVDLRTVSGTALNISGAKTVSVDKSLGTGPRQADGSTTVLTPQRHRHRHRG